MEEKFSELGFTGTVSTKCPECSAFLALRLKVCQGKTLVMVDKNGKSTEPTAKTNEKEITNVK